MRCPAPAGRSMHALRRALGTAVVAFILWGAAFAPLAGLGEAPPDPAQLTIPRLFLLHGLMAAALAAWYALGYLPRPGRSAVAPTGARSSASPARRATSWRWAPRSGSRSG